jgi:hypothetical protein
MRQDVKGQGNGLIGGSSILRYLHGQNVELCANFLRISVIRIKTSMPDLQNTQQDYYQLESSDNIKFLKFQKM